HRRGEVFDLAGSARGDERHVDGGAGGTDELEIESLTGAVGVDGVEQDLADPAVGGFPDPVDGAASRAFAAAAGGDLESGCRGRPLCPAGVEGEDEDLVAEVPGDLTDELRVLHRRSVDRDLVGPVAQQTV